MSFIKIKIHTMDGVIFLKNFNRALEIPVTADEMGHSVLIRHYNAFYCLL